MKHASKFYLLPTVAAAFALLITGCIDHPDAPGPDNGPEGGNGFNYANTVDVKLTVDYGQKGNVAKIEVYAENPVTETDGVVTKKADVKALLKAYTDANCKYSGVIELPTRFDKVYIYSDSYGVPSCVEADVTANGVSFNLPEVLEKLRREMTGTAAAAVTARSATRAYSVENPHNVQVLGTWNEYGLVDYIIGEMYKGWLKPTLATIPDNLFGRIQNVLPNGKNNSQYARPAEVVNLNVKENARIKLVFLTEMGAWRNAIGYYYYDTQNPPKTQKDFEQIPKYVAFPNCTVYPVSAVGESAPLWGGEQLQMLYHKNGVATEVFPAGTTIGWFMLPDGFELNSKGTGELNITGSKHPIRYSNNEFNANGSRYMVSLYDKASGKTVLGFEDGGDNDYKDVLFYVDADPASSIDDPERPEIEDPDSPKPDIVGDPIEGTLAFEDLWPSQGDYDMNDVVVLYSTTFTTDKDNRIVSIKDVFTPQHNGGKLNNAFGYQLNIPGTAVRSVKIENGLSTAYTTNGMENGQGKATFMLFDKIEDAVAQGKPITVTITLDGSVSMKDVTHKSLYNPFICPSETVRDAFVPGAIRREIHLTDCPPTDLADLTLYGRHDDRSTVDQSGKPIGPYYYRTSDLHPFAIDLPIIGYRIPDESVSIDDFYPDFAGWVTSKGEKNKDWYLRVAR